MHKAGAVFFGMLLLNLITWQQWCSILGFVCVVWVGKYALVDPTKGQPPKPTFPNLVPIHTKHVGAMCPSWVLPFLLKIHQLINNLNLCNQISFTQHFVYHMCIFLLGESIHVGLLLLLLLLIEGSVNLLFG